MKKWFFVRAVKGIVFITLAVFVFGYVVTSLWNCLVPELFHGPVITYWQALGLLLLSKILFGGFHRGWGGRCGHGHGWHGHHHHWREKWEAKMAAMTPEEREKIKQGFKRKCGWDWDKPADQGKTE